MPKQISTNELKTVVHAVETYAPGILHRLLIKLAWNYSRPEGNTDYLLERDFYKWEN